jgi:saccharopine dehydrogenase (NADP+, L-glutamate forming)
MQPILLFGAGRSSYFLIDYLLREAAPWGLAVADIDVSQLAERHGHSDRLEAITLDIYHAERRRALVQEAHLVISLLPPDFHPIVAADCAELGRSLITASYTNPEMRQYEPEFRRKGQFVLPEMGFDPGIDHMSAMREIDALHQEGARVEAFRSYAGGLMRPDSSQNPWGYKVTWNPGNVAKAGQSGGHYLHEGVEKWVPYPRIFRETASVTLPSVGPLEAYLNRDALPYREAYGIEEVRHLARYTLRRPGFCAGWQVLVELGLTEPHQRLRSVEPGEPVSAFVARLLPEGFDHPRAWLRHHADRLPAQTAAQWESLGLLSDEPVGLTQPSPAEVLAQCLSKHLGVAPDDVDELLLLHRIGYHKNGRAYERRLSMRLEGQDAVRTAMARCVGLPPAVAAHLVLERRLQLFGLQLPTHPEVYQSVLPVLQRKGVHFHREDIPQETA